MNSPPIVAFAGPTVRPDELAELLGGDAQVFGPVGQGDVVRAGRLGAQIICIIDGYFQSVPAVWHKEILWAMTQGVHVFGAASMGALRAAELHTFGMVGVGQVFEWFRDGVLTRDDEVAVAHATAEYDYRNASEALVNIRATVAAAAAAGALVPPEATLVIDEAAARFYPDRTWPGLYDALRDRGEAPLAGRLAAYVADQGRIDQKRLDALALVRLVKDTLAELAAPKQVAFSLSRTLWLDVLERSAGEFATTGGTSPQTVGVGGGDIVDELRVSGHYRQALRAALLRRLSANEAERRLTSPAATQLANFANDFCHDRGLTDQAAFESWLATNGLSLDRFNELMAHELRRSPILAETSRSAHAEMDDVLRLAGLWPAVSARAARKAQLLAETGLAEPGLDQTPFATADELVTWWYGQRGSAGAPPDADLEIHAKRADFGDRETFVQALLREYCAQAQGLEPLDDEGHRW